MLNPPFLSTKKKSILVIRKTPGVYTNGRYAEAVPTSLTIEGNIQPGLRFNDTQYLAEGERGRRCIRIYTSSELRTRQEGVGGYDADEVVYNGITYVCKWSHYYDMGVLNHWKAILVEKEST